MKLLQSLLGFTVGNQAKKELFLLLVRLRLALALIIGAAAVVIISAVIASIYFLMQIFGGS